jgi:hypothetical protein
VLAGFQLQIATDKSIGRCRTNPQCSQCRCKSHSRFSSRRLESRGGISDSKGTG